jgi:hypothetical protein
MVPAQIVALDQLPLTPSGKVDRQALPAPGGARPEFEADFVAPRTPTEELLAGIWEAVLGMEGVGIHDNFLELGGHSLLATQVVSRVREAFGVEVALRTLFGASTTVGRLAEAMLRDPANRAKIERTAELMLQLQRLSEAELDSILATRQASQGK